MPKHGKKYQEAAKLIESQKLYDPDEAFELVKKTATAKFDETETDDLLIWLNKAYLLFFYSQFTFYSSPFSIPDFLFSVF